MSSSTAKRVLVYRFDRLPSGAMVDASGWLLTHGIEVLSFEGELERIPHSELKALCFVSNAGAADLFTVQPLFERRPKTPGLWTRFRFRDDCQLDGILPHNVLDWPPEGYLFAPPKASAARQRVFVPRAALRDSELLGVIGLAGTKQARKRPDTGLRQIELF